MEPSPYLPTTRRFVNPMYIRVEDIPELGYVSAAERQLLEWHADDARALNTDDVIDRDASWQAKSAALRIVFALPRSARRERAFAAFVEREGQGLVDFATWCALAREARAALGRVARGAARPPRRRRRGRPGGPRRGRAVPPVAAVGRRRAARDTCSRTPAQAGMAIGVVHDLAVGVHPAGADAWGLADALRPAGQRGRAAGPVQPDGAGLEPAAVAAGPAAGAGLRAVPRHAAHRAAPRGRHPGRPRHRPVPALVGAGGRRPTPGHLRALRPRGADRHPRPGGAPRRRPRRRRGPRRRSSRGCATTCASAGILGTSILWFEKDERGPAAAGRRPTASCAWPPSPPTTCRRPRATSPASTSTCARSWAC